MSEAALAPADITRLLRAWNGGDAAAGDRLMQLVYARMRRLAAHQLRISSNAPITPTELVHELVGNLLEADVAWQDRVHFFRTAAVAMRRILLNLGRARRAEKRGGGAIEVTLSHADDAPVESLGDAESLAEALSDLAQLDPRKAETVELCYFVGLSLEEIALTLEVSLATVNRDMRFARAWLKERLST